MNVEATKIIGRVQAGLLDLDITDATDRERLAGQRKAAIMIPLVWRTGAWQVIFTQRTNTLPHHSGEISFPGGRTGTDESALQAALRELYEEIGIQADAVQPLGRLPSFDAVSGFRVTPFAGIVDACASIRPCPREVAEVFEVPFLFFMDAQNHIPRMVCGKEQSYRLYDMPYKDACGVHRHIWGMTAMMLYQLWQRAFAP